jgi:Domain of unknown function (DUF4258)
MSEPLKPIVFSRHALERCKQRGAAETDVIAAIRNGKREPAQRGLWLFRLNLEYQREWGGKYYAVQQISPIVDEGPDRLVVVTIYTFYF